MKIVATIVWCLAVVAWRLAAARGERHDVGSREAGQDRDNESGILKLPRCRWILAGIPESVRVRPLRPRRPGEHTSLGVPRHRRGGVGAGLASGVPAAAGRRGPLKPA